MQKTSINPDVRLPPSIPKESALSNQDLTTVPGHLNVGRSVMKPKPQSTVDMPPPRKPPGRTAATGDYGDGPKRKPVRINLPPKPTATQTIRISNSVGQ